jgi:hypothetical protein
MLTNVDKDIFLKSSSIELQPVVSAEWNQNLFNPPYLTVAGSGIKESVTKSSGTTTLVTDVSLKNPNFETYSFNLANDGSGQVVYACNTLNHSPAYKIVTYVKTDNVLPVMINTFAKGTSSQFGSATAEPNSFGWTKIETWMGSGGYSDGIQDITFTISVHSFSNDAAQIAKDASNGILSTKVYYTTPEIYETTFNDYEYHSIWSTDNVFTGFRPGDSYVGSGDVKYTFPDNYRKINSEVINGYSTPTYSPISAVVQNPKFSLLSVPIPVFKNVLPSDISAYKYYVSDIDNDKISNISAKYPQNISTNKLVLKFNVLMTNPTVSIFLDGSSTPLTVDGQTTLSPNSHGLIVLYWDGTKWTTKKWGDQTASPIISTPKFNIDGSLSLYTTINEIRVKQVDVSVNTDFAVWNVQGTDAYDDFKRMQVIEVSPRLEIDLTNYVISVDVNKSLDSKNNYVPISSLNADDATIHLSAIPVVTPTSILPLFSSQSSLDTNVLTNMLRKNIKFYVSFNVISYFSKDTGLLTPVNVHVPTGVFYSDVWDETDIKSVKIQCYDITRYLQTTPVPDYVSHLKSIFDVLTNILDLAGFTDYDYDSLYQVCNDRNAVTDLAYFYCNSKDTTIVDALSELFLAYQIGAYIDEYGIMKFKSLANILGATGTSMTLDDSNIITGGYSISNKAKPGKVSLRYQTPKIKQSLSLQNITNLGVKESPSFIFTTANDVVWQQQSLDSVGFNYLNASMEENASKFKLNINDLLDIFHTFSLNNNGYAAIEDEIVSFNYKEYRIYDPTNNAHSVAVSVKSDLELASEVNKFTKKYKTGLEVTDGKTKSDYNVRIDPTGYITNIQRGLFGTKVAPHIVMSSLSDKGLIEATVSAQHSIQLNTSNTSIVDSINDYPHNPSIKKISCNVPASDKVLIMPASDTDNSYSTYSVKFDFSKSEVAAAGLFFNLVDTSTADGAYFVELIRFNNLDPKTKQFKIDSSKTEIADFTYIIAIYQETKGLDNIIAWSDVTGIANIIVNNFAKVFVKTPNGDTPLTYTYSTTTDEAFQLKVVHYPSESNDGEQGGELISVFLNNIEINGWQIAPYSIAKPTSSKVVNLTLNSHAQGTIDASWLSVTGSSSYTAQCNGIIQTLTGTTATFTNLSTKVNWPVTVKAYSGANGSGNLISQATVYYIATGIDSDPTTQQPTTTTYTIYADWNLFSDRVVGLYGTGPTVPQTGHRYKTGTTTANNLSSAQIVSALGVTYDSHNNVVATGFSAVPTPPAGQYPIYADWNKFSDAVNGYYGNIPSVATRDHAYKAGSTNTLGLSGSAIVALIGNPPTGYSSSGSGNGGGSNTFNQDLTTGWMPTRINDVTKLRQKVILNGSVTSNSHFGFYASSKPVDISKYIVYRYTNPTGLTSVIDTSSGTTSIGGVIASCREIYATQKPLKERSVNYYYQDREFLNGLIQNQNIFARSKTYHMQTTPEVIGINVYDVQYTTPAAVSVDYLPIEYAWYYYPGPDSTDQQHYSMQEIDEYSLSYSTPLNTGFRAKMALVNNSPHMVYISKQADQVNNFTINFNLWTHEIIAPSDPEIIEKIIDPANISEVAQLDSQWIQSKESANKLLNLIRYGIDGFSKDTTIQVFGNPLIQVGDIISLTYSLTGITIPQTYLVHSVSHSFSQGLKTTIVANRLDKSISY